MRLEKEKICSTNTSTAAQRVLLSSDRGASSAGPGNPPGGRHSSVHSARENAGHPGRADRHRFERAERSRLCQQEAEGVPEAQRRRHNGRADGAAVWPRRQRRRAAVASRARRHPASVSCARCPRRRGSMRRQRTVAAGNGPSAHASQRAGAGFGARHGQCPRPTFAPACRWEQELDLPRGLGQSVDERFRAVAGA